MKFLLSIVFITISIFGHGQIIVEGHVKDSLQQSLELANVIAFNTETESIESYAISDHSGYYKLEIKEGFDYRIEVSYIGMKKEDQIITGGKDNFIIDFVLRPDNLLSEIVLTYTMPVSVRGDTLRYDADSFTNGNEKKLEDVLKKLPGVKINKDGEIELEGKTVNKVMVEGKDFFDGDTKIATKNIPADAIDKIDFLKNYDDVGQLRGVRDNEDNIAMNIKLKEGKKSFWFGELTAGLGLEKRYLVHPKLFYYSPKYSLNIITDINDIGKVPFTTRDYFNFTGGFQSQERGNGTNFNIRTNEMGLFSLHNNRTAAIETQFGAVNWSITPIKNWTISAFIIYTGTRTEMQQNSIKNYALSSSNQSILEESERFTDQVNDLGLLKIKSRYKISSTKRIDYELLGNYSNQREVQDYSSSLYGNILEHNGQNPYRIKQHLKYYYTLTENDIFSFAIHHLLQKENPFYEFESNNKDQFGLSNLLGLEPNNQSINLNQNQQVLTHKADFKMSYWRIINAYSNIRFSIGTMQSKQKLESDIIEVVDGNKKELDNAKLAVNNDADYKLQDYYFDIKYRLKTGKITISPSLSLHRYNSNNIQYLEHKNDYQFWSLLPSFQVKAQLKKAESITLRYNLENSFTDINQIAEGLILNSYDVLKQGNNELKQALSHNISLNYFNFNMFSLYNIFGFVNYNKRINSIQNSVDFIVNEDSVSAPSINRILNPTHSNFANESFMINGQYEKTIGAIKGSLEASFNLAKFNQMLNEKQSLTTSYNQSYELGLATNFRNAPNVEIGYSILINHYHQGAQKNIYYTHNPFINFDVRIWKSFLFKADWSFYNYRDDVKTINNYSFLNASLSYQQKESKWEFELKANNILNTKTLYQDNSNYLYTSSTSYKLLPRILTFSVTYDL